MQSSRRAHHLVTTDVRDHYRCDHGRDRGRNALGNAIETFCSAAFCIAAPLAFSGQNVALFTSGWSQDDRASSNINVSSLKVGDLQIQIVHYLCLTVFLVLGQS